MGLLDNLFSGVKRDMESRAQNEIRDKINKGIDKSITKAKEQMNKCPFCKKKLTEDEMDESFCPYCGKNMQLTCKKCGSKYPLNKKFCANCGGKLG